MVYLPLPNLVKVSASMESAEVGMRDALVVHPAEDERRNVAIAHEFYANHLDAVICEEQSVSPSSVRLPSLLHQGQTTYQDVPAVPWDSRHDGSDPATSLAVSCSGRETPESETKKIVVRRDTNALARQ